MSYRLTDEKKKNRKKNEPMFESSGGEVVL